MRGQINIKDFLGTVTINHGLYGNCSIKFYLSDATIVAVVPIMIDGIPLLPPLVPEILDQAMNYLMAQQNIDFKDPNPTDGAMAFALGLKEESLHTLRLRKCH